jgi:hypothetical protein
MLRSFDHILSSSADPLQSIQIQIFKKILQLGVPFTVGRMDLTKLMALILTAKKTVS